MNRLLNIFEQYKTIPPHNKKKNPKEIYLSIFIIILAKTGSLKLVLDARYLNSLVDEPKCNRPKETNTNNTHKKNGQCI